MTDTTLRAELRPPGDFRDLIQRLSDRLMDDPPKDNQCQTASRLGFAFWWMTDRERQSIDERMISALAGMLTREANDGDQVCIIRTAAYVLGHIGPRARSALPALKAQLAKLDADQDFQRVKKELAKKLVMNEGSLDVILKGAIESIEGAEKN